MLRNNRNKVLNQMVNELKKKVVIVSEKLRKSELEGIEKQLIINTAQKRIEKLEGCNKALIDNNAEIQASKNEWVKACSINADKIIEQDKDMCNIISALKYLTLFLKGEKKNLTDVCNCVLKADKKEVSELSSEIFKICNNNEELEKDKNDWMNKALEDISGASSLREENSVLKNRVASIEHKLSQEVETSTYWKGQAMDKNKDLETVREWNDELTQKAESIEKDRKYWIGRYNESEDNLKEMTKQKQAFEKKSKLLEAELNADKKVIQDYVDEVSARDKKIEDLKALIDEKNTEIAFYKDIANKFEDECINLKRELTVEKSKHWWERMFKRG